MPNKFFLYYYQHLGDNNYAMYRLVEIDQKDPSMAVVNPFSIPGDYEKISFKNLTTKINLKAVII